MPGALNNDPRRRRYLSFEQQSAVINILFMTISVAPFNITSPGWKGHGWYRFTGNSSRMADNTQVLVNVVEMNRTDMIMNGAAIGSL